MAQYPSSAAGDSHLYVAVNNLETLLVGALGASGGNNGADIEVVSTTSFPTSGFITIGNEAIAYTSLLSGPPRFSGITRGSDSTTAAAHSDGSRVRLTQIAAHHNALKDEVKAIENDLIAVKAALNDSDTPASTATDVTDRLDQIVTQLKALSGETNWYTATSARVKRSGDTMSGNLAMGGNKVTGLAAGSTNGDAVRYEQVSGVYLPLAGGTVTGDIVLDNQKELRLREATAGGTEYVSLKAPAALASNVNLTLPSDAGSNGYALKTDGTGVLSWGQASGGTKNYITNNDAEGGTTGWATYNDSSADPVDGTGGSPTTTLTASGSTPLSGAYSFLLTKDAANRQGEGCSVNFDIDVADKAKPLYISFDYLTSTNFADDDMSVWIYDRTNGTLTQPAPYLIKKVGQSERWNGVFQTAINSTAYRLIIHIKSTNASAYTLQFDNVKIGPNLAVMGSPVTDWQSYTPTFTGFGTATSVEFQYRRVGDSVEILGKFTTGTVTATEARISLPSGLTSDSVKIPSIRVVGVMSRNVQSAYNIVSALMESSVSYLTAGFWSGANASTVLTKVNANSLWNASETTTVHAIVPIAGWSSSVLMSDQAETRLVSLFRTNSNGITIPNGTSPAIDFVTAGHDTHGGWQSGVGYSAGTWTTEPGYYVRVPGKYQIAANILSGNTSMGTGDNFDLRVYKNGSLFQVISHVGGDNTGVARSWMVNGSCIVDCNTNDFLKITMSVNRSGGNVITNSTSYSSVSISRISGPSQIAATETVACRYAGNAGPSVTGTMTVLPFTNKGFDSHNAYNTSTGTFTAPVSGVYVVNSRQQADCSSSSVNNNFYFFAYKNGNSISEYYMSQPVTGVSGPIIAVNDFTVRLIAGDTIDFRVMKDPSISVTLATSAGRSYMNITRIGNYV